MVKAERIISESEKQMAFAHGERIAVDSLKKCGLWWNTPELIDLCKEGVKSAWKDTKKEEKR